MGQQDLEVEVLVIHLDVVRMELQTLEVELVQDYQMVVMVVQE
tara:strand:- start:915 stop:1043 length:129 start_codon:yes stop_codon:yes gene_type:complete